MRLFRKFRSQANPRGDRAKPAADQDIVVSPALRDTTQSDDREDFLGKAAAAGHAATAAVKAGQYDAAWGLLHEQKTLYAQHASRGGWKASDVLCLDGSVSENLANILRLEQKHDQALVHIIYWIATSRNPIKRHGQKLKAYFGRCKFRSVSLDDVERFIERSKARPDYVTIQSKVADWKDS